MRDIRIICLCNECGCEVIVTGLPDGVSRYLCSGCGYKRYFDMRMQIVNGRPDFRMKNQKIFWGKNY